MALTIRNGPRPGLSVEDPPHHVCALAIAGAFALMFAAAPVAIWLVDTAFSAMR